MSARSKGELTSLNNLLDVFHKQTLRVLDKIEAAMVSGEGRVGGEGAIGEGREDS